MSGKQRVVVIGLDGATWDLLRPRMDEGSLPNLKRLADEGATGDLRSIYPPETPAAWPSFMTGKNPGKHGNTPSANALSATGLKPSRYSYAPPRR